jgi:hypothetical protein
MPTQTLHWWLSNKATTTTSAGQMKQTDVVGQNNDRMSYEPGGPSVRFKTNRGLNGVAKTKMTYSLANQNAVSFCTTDNRY